MIQTNRTWTAALLLGAAMVVVANALPATAGERLSPLGDGSEFDNPGLKRQPSAGCEKCALAVPPHEWDAPFFDADWSLALRGAYVRDTDGEHYELQILPRFSLRRDTMRGGYGIAAAGQITRSSLGSFQITEVSLALDGDYALDAATTLRGTLDFSSSQERTGAPGLPGGIAAAPIALTGAAEAAMERRFGQFALEASAGAARAVYGPTTLSDGSQRDNGAQNNWQLNAGVRLGYAVTPILTAFIDGNAGYQLYDAPSPTYLVKLDATDYEVRTGLAAAWNEVLEAEASVGLGLRRFAASSLGEVATTLYDASLTFRPDETVTLEAGFSTRFGAPGPNSGGTARLEHAATATARYRVNPWLLLRASAGWRQAQLIGTTQTERRYDLGAGLDYTLNQNTALTADYGYSHARTTPAAGEEEQRVTLGVTFSR